MQVYLVDLHIFYSKMIELELQFSLYLELFEYIAQGTGTELNIGVL